MAATIDTAYVNQFQDSMHILVQQEMAKLRGTVMMTMGSAEIFFFDRLGKIEVTEITGRRQPTNLTDPSHSRRAAIPKRYHAGTTLDDIDKFKMMIDPTNDYTRQLAAGQGRNIDAVILDALLGTAATGKDGTGSQAFDTTNQQIAHGSAGFTIAKFNQGIRILQGNEVDMDITPIFLALGARGIEDLRADSNFTSFDFQEIKTLAGRRLPQYLGVTIIPSERIQDETSGTTFRGVLYTNRACSLGMNEDITVETARDHTHNYVHQIDTYMQFGAVRMEEELVVDILYQ